MSMQFAKTILYLAITSCFVYLQDTNVAISSCFVYLQDTNVGMAGITEFSVLIGDRPITMAVSMTYTDPTTGQNITEESFDDITAANKVLLQTKNVNICKILILSTPSHYSGSPIHNFGSN